MTHRYLACDLGAESGRLMLGHLSNGRLQMEELHRFPNIPAQSGSSLHWKIEELYHHLKTGLAKAAALPLAIESISTDAWGVDYVLLAPDGTLIPPAFHYRDPRSARGVEAAHARLSPEEIFSQTGIQFMPFNSLYQLMAEEPGRLTQARTLLGIGDAFNYLLCEVARAEVSFASTTQLYNPITRRWAGELITRLQLPRGLFPKIVPSGSLLGQTSRELTRETGLPTLNVIASCSHDTAAAVAAIPAGPGSWAYISSGTWSLMGVELPQPIVTTQCREFNYTNEVGYGDSIRLLKNIVGLWIIQECRRHWEAAGQDYDYATLTRLAEAAPPFASLIRPSDPRFLSPGGMPGTIAAFCRETGQPAPTEPGPVIRCVLESLALLYRLNLRQIEQLTGTPVERLHVVGGGSKNALLNQFTANALQIPVLAGPAEATATGNVLIQALALNQIPSLSAAREIVARSEPTQTFTPRNPTEWEKAWARFQTLD